MVMTVPQALTFGILAATMTLFIWGRWRYDVVAFTALVAGTVTGVVPAAEAFHGFGHPAVITVATVLVISRALQNSGVIDHIASRLNSLASQPLIHIGALTTMAAVLSAFMNNVGALALLMPVALQTCAAVGRSPAQVLMPLSFGSILGGLMTLMGTPPNIIIASYRQQYGGEAFSVFDFSPVGGAVALIGVLFVSLVGWRLIPRARLGKKAAADLFEIRDYIIEARVLEDSPLIGKGLKDLESVAEHNVLGVGVLRGENHTIAGARYARLRAGDIVVIEADPGALPPILEATGLELRGEGDFDPDVLSSEEIELMEAVVTPGSRLVGRSFRDLHITARYDLNLIALARQGRAFKKRLDNVSFLPGDVVLLQGRRDDLAETVAELGCLPLAKRGLRLAKRPRAFLPLASFAAALAAAAIGLMPVHVAFAAAVAFLVTLGVVSLRDLYTAIDWPVIVLLGAMIPLGQALESTGGTGLIAGLIVSMAGNLGPIAIMALLLIVTMTLSDIMNNAATAVVMAPIAATLAGQLGVSADPYLMAVAVGASCAFLTPIGHQNNVLVMGPGGYAFGDFWRMGLPLEILVVAVSVPLIVLVWPL